jgi:hypothetical protein
MKINPDAPAFPQAAFTTNNNEVVIVSHYFKDNAGLTIRAEIASRVLAGFAAGPDTGGTIEQIAEYAVKWADALINELNKSKQCNP